MLIQSSLLSSVEDGLCYVSDDGKDVLCDRMPSGQTWQVCLKCNKYPLDWCRKAEPMEDARRNVDDPYSSNCLSSFGRPSTASIMTENTAPNMVYRRKKLRKGTNAPLFKLGPTDVQTSVNFPSIISSSAHLSSTGDQSAGFQDKHEIEMVKNHTVPSMLFDGVAKDTTQKNLGIDSINDSWSSSKSNMELVSNSIETEMDDSGECSSSSVIVMDATEEGLTEKDFCINILRSHGLLRGDSLADNVASLEDAFTTDSYHPSCYNPRLKKLPIDEWFCHSCLKKRQKILKEAIIRSPSIHSEMGKCRTASVKTELNPIMLMLKNTEPYTTGVRVGKGFQAEVPDWSGPKRSDEDDFPEPLEINPSEFSTLQEKNMRNPTRLSSIGNWLQCQEVIDRANGTICGKWRRAPLFEIQTDDWECFCAIHWDPSHADCAVPQVIYD
ncbi:Zinc finger, FYVE/PHD-type [Sesbania bispinosa]|nr:Zinc finger, FYVE/PHD-type [Sesbania bispinosa]